MHLTPTKAVGGDHRLGNETDYDALLAIKSQLVAHPGVFSSWNHSLHHCQWEGVTCGSKHDRVIGLNLSSRGLVGTISPFIGNLSFLRIVALYNNSLVGKIPPEFARLFKLQTLRLFNNTIGGEIPTNLSACINLQKLSVGYNKLEGKLPSGLSALSKLKGLFVYSNNFNGPLFEIISNLTSLVTIAARFNGFTGYIPSSVGKMVNLTFLDVSYNNFIGRVPHNFGALYNLRYVGLFGNHLEGDINFAGSFVNCSQLETLDLGQNEFTGTLPHSIANLSTSLQTLYLDSNGITGVIPIGITNLINLNRLELAENNFTGRVPHNFGALYNLLRFGLDGNHLEGDINFAGSFVNCSQLEVLYLGINEFTGTLPNSIANLSINLQTLSFHSNGITGVIPIGITNLINLNILDVAENNFIGRVPHNFGALYNLRQLISYGNHLEGDINFVGNFVNCSQLETLNLGQNEFKGTLPHSIANLSINLRQLFLNSNGITGVIPVGITNLINLQRLQLDNNELIGSIPRDLEKLQKLEGLYLSGNKLTGSIPNTLGNLSLLSNLYLTHNQLEGRIPPSLGSSQSLSTLGLSSNHLNGTIEKLFDGPAKFVVVNISNNHFQGSIPLEINKQINLVEFYASQNKFSGTIPFGLGDCFSLTTLDIHANFFYGEIPSSFSSLRGLQSVDFSENNLSGTIPNYFSKFPLQVLNLSHNNFEGEVPTRGVFANVSGIALDGNIKLCGGIPQLRLPKCINGRKKRKPISKVLKLTLPIICSFVGIVIIMTCICLIFQRKKRVPSSSDSIRESLMKVSYDMLLKATNGFSSENLIGSGGFGSVFKGGLDGMTIAVKVLNLQTRGASKSFMAECKALRNVRHRNLVGIITACSSIDFNQNDFKALVYEFMPNGSLDRWLHENGAEKLTLLQRVDIALDVAHALNYLHSDCESPIVHCDLKPSNVLLDDDMVARVGDFGLAKFLAQPQHPNQSSSIGVRGTIGYAAPEYGIGSEPSQDGDIYSYGILVLELMTGKSPTDNQFQENYSLHKYAEEALPDNVLQIVDPVLVHNDIAEEADDVRAIQEVAERRVECMISLISVGVACSKHLPQDRMKISEAIRKLQVSRDSLCNARQRRTNTRGA